MVGGEVDSEPRIEHECTTEHNHDHEHKEFHSLGVNPTTKPDHQQQTEEVRLPWVPSDEKLSVEVGHSSSLGFLLLKRAGRLMAEVRRLGELVENVRGQHSLEEDAHPRVVEQQLAAGTQQRSDDLRTQ